MSHTLPLKSWLPDTWLFFSHSIPLSFHGWSILSLWGYKWIFLGPPSNTVSFLQVFLLSWCSSLMCLKDEWCIHIENGVQKVWLEARKSGWIHLTESDPLDLRLAAHTLSVLLLLLRFPSENAFYPFLAYRSWCQFRRHRQRERKAQTRCASLRLASRFSVGTFVSSPEESPTLIYLCFFC